MPSRLREAAQRYLLALPSSASGEVQRLTVDIAVGGRTELVTVSLRDGELHCVSSDGNNDGPHVQAALAFVAGLDTPVSQKHTRLAERGEEVPSERGGGLAEGIDDLVTAITRIGVAEAAASPSVEEALQRIVDSAPEPTPPGLVRFVGRMRAALHYADQLLVARVLRGASLLAQDLRAEETSTLQQHRMQAWLGRTSESGPNLELLSDRTLVELGREWLWGTERGSIERRYLVDLASGEVFREDRLRSDVGSLGPAPRQLSVGLAEVQQGPAPRRIRILQYAVSPTVSPVSWQRVEQLASRDFGAIAERYYDEVLAFPALAEPFTFVSAASYDREDGLTPLDTQGYALPIVRSDHHGVALTLDKLATEEGDPSWLAGRLIDVEGTLMLAPFGLAVGKGATTRYHRLR